jgi:ABC-2 type transport system ATP-binding protein
MAIIYNGKLVFSGRMDDPAIGDRPLEEFFLELVN